MIALAASLSMAAQVPDLPRLPPIQRDPQIAYLDRTGAVIGVRGGRFAGPVDVARLPAYVPAAFVAIEDRRFYEHQGFDPRGIARAVVTGLGEGRLSQGASTITQQLARNLFLGQERTLERKAVEIAYAVQIERTYTKAQILGLYLSRVYFGSGAYGLEAAAQRFFGKPASRLSLKEAAMLAGVLKSPTGYNPVEQPDRCEQRARLVLDAMAETGAITPAQRDRAVAQKPRVLRTASTAASQYFVDWIDAQVRQIVGRPSRDLVVETTLDLPMTTAAATAVRAGVAANRAQAADQAALVAVDGGGRVRAMVGGVDHAAAPFNRAVAARRQAGSAWKPFVYLAAMESGRTPDTVVTDEPVVIGGWSPSNYDGAYLGPITLEVALARSVNTVAARLADEVGRPAVAAVARRVGVTSPINSDPAMALGSTLVTPLEMTQAYATFANGGARVQAYGLERIRAGGKVIYQRRAAAPVQAIANPALSDLNRMLRTVVSSGTGTRSAIPGHDIAGKTGTTSDYKDAWFCGYTGGLASCAWMGRDDARPMARITGGGAPAMMWRAFFVTAMKRSPTRSIPAGPLPSPPPLPDESVADEAPPNAAVDPPMGPDPVAPRPVP